MKYFLWLNIWCLGGFVGFAQNQKVVEDSIKRIELQVVTVLEQKEDIQAFHYIQNFEHSNLSTSKQLSQSSHLYLNEQGPNLLTTAAIRGQSAQAIPVIWKNWTLNSAMNGIFDLSLINSYLLNKTSVVFSESQQSAGWGGAGASLLLDNSTDFSNREICYQYGSFGKQQIGASFGFQRKNMLSGLTEFSNQTKAFYHKANNNFLLNLPDNDTLKQVNNALLDFGFMNSTELTFTNQHKLNLDLWWQKTNREIPPKLGLRNTKSHQLDSAFRMSFNWLHPNQKLEAGSAYFNELNQYIDPFYKTNGIHKVRSFKSFVRLSEAITTKLSSYSTVSYEVSRASSTNLAEADHFRNTVQLKSHLIYQMLKIPLSIKIDAVAELTDGKFLPFRPGLYANYTFKKNFQIKGQFSRHYRLPTFNDLYWQDKIFGQARGNLDLVPEEGWLSELHASYQIKYWSGSVSLFNNIINDKIDWLPNGAFWQTQNLDKVHNRGFDVQMNYQYQFSNKATAKIETAYTFAKAVKVKSTTANDNSLFKQLIYKPKHKIVGSAMFSFQNFSFNWAYRFVGKRFTATDHSEFIAAYHLSDFTFSYLVPVDDLKINLSATIFNLFNTPYEVIIKRPMPGRHFLLTSNFKF